MDIWHLVYDDGQVITLFQCDGDDETSHGSHSMFFGTYAECLAKIVELKLLYDGDLL